MKKEIQRTKQLEILKTKVGSVTAKKADGTLQAFDVLYGGGMLPWIDGKMKYVSLDKYKKILREFLTETDEGKEYIVPSESQIVADRTFVMNNDKKGLYSLKTESDKEAEKEGSQKEAPQEETTSKDKQAQKDETQTTENSESEETKEEEKQIDPELEPYTSIDDEELEKVFNEKKEESNKSVSEENKVDEESDNELNDDDFSLKDTEIENLKKEKEELIKKSTKEVNDAKSEVGNLKRKLADANKMIEELKNVQTEPLVQTNSEELDVLKQELENTKEQLKVAIEGSNNSSLDLINLKGELEKAKTDLNNANFLLESKNNEYDSVSRELEAHKTALASSKEETQNVRNELETLKLQGEDAKTKAEVERNTKIVNAIKTQNAAIIELRDKVNSLDGTTNALATKGVTAKAEVDPKQFVSINKQIKTLKTMILGTIVAALLACVLIPLCSMFNLRDKLNLNNHDEVELHAVINGDNGETDYVLIGTFSVEDGVITFDKNN